MQIVIDDEKIIDLLEMEWGYEGIREDTARVIMENGTPLPKGHGRLIDADKFISEHFGEVARLVDDEPTIIEADTESEE